MQSLRAQFTFVSFIGCLSRFLVHSILFIYRIILNVIPDPELLPVLRWDFKRLDLISLFWGGRGWRLFEYGHSWEAGTRQRLFLPGVDS